MSVSRLGDYWYSKESCSLEEFASLISQRSEEQKRLTFASALEMKVPLYDCPSLSGVLTDKDSRLQLLLEWGSIFRDGPGVIVLKHAFPNKSVIDEATSVFDEIVQKERERSGPAADHFAKTGANDRIWNALEKLCLKAPKVFARYYANEMLAAAAEAWLGPNYQVTSQINTVKPGGAAQSPHRDYHLGFQTMEEAVRYPAQVHLFSPFLTLQGAVAHYDSPLESGPTKLLPFSQLYKLGYLAYRRPDFSDFFEKHAIQLPLEKGDVVFFSPALFHAAGTNQTKNVLRMMNLLQISSAFGRAMESVRRLEMSRVLYPVVMELRREGSLSVKEAECAIASCAEGYPFPTNIDTDPPIGGLAPQSQQALFRQALHESWAEEKFIEKLMENAKKRRSC